MAKDKKISKLVKRLGAKYLTALEGVALYCGGYDLLENKMLDELDFRNLNPDELGHRMMAGYKCAVMLSEIFSLYGSEEFSVPGEVNRTLDQYINFVERSMTSCFNRVLSLKIKE